MVLGMAHDVVKRFTFFVVMEYLDVWPGGGFPVDAVAVVSDFAQGSCP